MYGIFTYKTFCDFFGTMLVDIPYMEHMGWGKLAKNHRETKYVTLAGFPTAALSAAPATGNDPYRFKKMLRWCHTKKSYQGLSAANATQNELLVYATAR